MPEAVIVDAFARQSGARSRARSPSCARTRWAPTWSMRCSGNSEVDPASIEDLYCGCGLPQGLQAFNIARIIVLLSERMPMGVNGATISRYCASSLESIRQAANAVVAGQGDAYVAAGVEWVSRYNERQEAAGGADQNERLQGRNGDLDAYIAMGVTAENVAEKYEVSRADMDKHAQRSQELAVGSQENGFFDREIVPVKLPDGGEVARDDGRARARRSRSCRSWSPPSRRAARSSPAIPAP